MGSILAKNYFQYGEKMGFGRLPFYTPGVYHVIHNGPLIFFVAWGGGTFYIVCEDKGQLTAIDFFIANNIKLIKNLKEEFL